MSLLLSVGWHTTSFACFDARFPVRHRGANSGDCESKCEGELGPGQCYVERAHPAGAEAEVNKHEL